MELGKWDDEEDITASLPGPSTANTADLDDIFQFEESLRLFDEEGVPPPKNLPPLPKGVTDLTEDRGVLLTKTRQGPSSGPVPTKEEPFVEIHYTGSLAATNEVFDSSRDQNYAMIVQLDIPPSGKSTLIRGLEIAMRELRPGDVAKIEVASRYAYGKDGQQQIPPDSDLRFEVEVLDVRATHKKVFKVDDTKQDMNRLDEIRKQRELAQQRREEEQALKDEEKKKKADRAAALKEKLANKNKGGKKGKGKKNK